jgi:hypothetical protein
LGVGATCKGGEYGDGGRIFQNVCDTQ